MWEWVKEGVLAWPAPASNLQPWNGRLIQFLRRGNGCDNVDGDAVRRYPLASSFQWSRIITGNLICDLKSIPRLFPVSWALMTWGKFTLALLHSNNKVLLSDMESLQVFLPTCFLYPSHLRTRTHPWANARPHLVTDQTVRFHEIFPIWSAGHMRHSLISHRQRLSSFLISFCPNGAILCTTAPTLSNNYISVRPKIFKPKTHVFSDYKVRF